ncbi:hypothetical protein IJG14_00565 [bacterium]|nr:hypothetical protein [bacterium]
MIQIWKQIKSQIDGKEKTILISVQANMDNAQYFCEKNRIEDVKLVKVSD